MRKGHIIKLLGGFIGFSALLVLGLTALVKLPKLWPEARSLLDLTANKGQNEVRLPKDRKTFGLFYKSLGQSPVNEPTMDDPADSLPSQQFTVELDVVFDQKEAERRLLHYQEKGLEVFYTPLHKKGRVYFRIRHGVLAKREQASELQAKLKSEYHLDGRVTLL